MLNRELANRARAAEAQKLLLAYEAARRHRSVKDTAISLQVDRKTITRLRSGSHSPNRKLWEALAEAYDKHYPSGYPEHIHAWLQKWRALRYFGEEKYELALLTKSGHQFEAAAAAFALATLSASKDFDCIEDEREFAKFRPHQESYHADAMDYLAQAEDYARSHLNGVANPKPSALRLLWKILVNRDVLNYRARKARPNLQAILEAGEALLEFEPYNWEVAWNCFNYASTLKQRDAVERLWPLVLELIPDLKQPDSRVPGDSYKHWVDDPDLAFAIEQLGLVQQFQSAAAA